MRWKFALFYIGKLIQLTLRSDKMAEFNNISAPASRLSVTCFPNSQLERRLTLLCRISHFSMQYNCSASIRIASYHCCPSITTWMMNLPSFVTITAVWKKKRDDSLDTQKCSSCCKSTNRSSGWIASTISRLCLAKFIREQTMAIQRKYVVWCAFCAPSISVSADFD